MANNPITVPLPQDLPETWAKNQIVSPDGVSAGLTPQHGYNYLMKQVNNAQQAAQELGEGIAGLSGDNLPASSDGGETISAALSNKADKGAPQRYELIYADGYTASGPGLNENSYSKDENNFVVLNFSVKRTDGGLFPYGILSVATLPEGFRPTLRPIDCAVVALATSGTASQYAIQSYIRNDGALILHVPSNFQFYSVSGTMCFYAN